MMKITHDFVAITKAVALNSKQGSWSPDCTDEGLSKLIQGWVELLIGGINARRMGREVCCSWEEGDEGFLELLP